MHQWVCERKEAVMSILLIKVNCKEISSYESTRKSLSSLCSSYEHKRNMTGRKTDLFKQVKSHRQDTRAKHVLSFQSGGDNQVAWQESHHTYTIHHTRLHELYHVLYIFSENFQSITQEARFVFLWSVRERLDRRIVTNEVGWNETVVRVLAWH